jgi:hypothetical protein
MRTASDEDRTDDLFRRVNEILYPPLTPEEQTLFDLCEEEIEKGMKVVLTVATALMTIKDKRLYRTRFTTFEEYVSTRWDFTARRAYQLYDFARLLANLKLGAPPPADPLPADPEDEDLEGEEWKTRTDPAVRTAVHILPTSERQGRLLANLRPDEQCTVWFGLVEKNGGLPPGSKQLAEAVRDFKGKSAAVPAEFRPRIMVYTDDPKWAASQLVAAFRGPRLAELIGELKRFGGRRR